MVGGLHPTLPPEWYMELLRRLRALDPNLFIKAFTAIETRHLAERIFKKPIRETLEILREAGLGALTGGGAEIFDPGVRDKICRGKETAEEWAEVHRTWHQMGMRSTATMLFGHIETLEQRVDHLRRLRELQDETAGFTGFVPFACVPETTAMSHIKPATAFEELCNLAVCRIYLDNFDHITAYWVSLGLPLGALALNYGVDDLHGTIMEEKIFHMAGATTPTQQTALALEKAIREAGRVPMQRDTWYRRIASTWQEPAPEVASHADAELVWRDRLSRAGGPADRLRQVSELEAADRGLRRAGPFRSSLASGRRDSPPAKLDAALVPVFEAFAARALTAWSMAWRSPAAARFIASFSPIEGELEEDALGGARSRLADLRASAEDAAAGVSRPEAGYVTPRAKRRTARLLIGNQAIDFRQGAPPARTSLISARSGCAAPGCRLFSPLAAAARCRRSRRRGFRFSPVEMRGSRAAGRNRRCRDRVRLRAGARATSPSTSASISGLTKSAALELFRELALKHGFIQPPLRPFAYC